MRSSRQRWGLAASLALLVGCGPPNPLAPPRPEPATMPATEGPPARDAAPGRVSAAVPAESSAETVRASVPERGPQGLTDLPLDGFLPALVSWPDTKRWPQPVLVAAHGAGDPA